MAAPPKLRRLVAKGFNVPNEMRPFVNQLLDTTNSFFADTSNALNKRLTLAANVVSEMKTVTVYGAEPTWTAVTAFATAGVSSFTSGDGYPECGYYIEPGGYVNVRGLLNIPTTAAAFGLITMPEGYRALFTSELLTSTASNNIGQLQLRGYTHPSTPGLIRKGDTISSSFFSVCCRYLAANPAAPAAFSGTSWPIVLQPQRVRMTADSLVLPLQYLDLDNTSASVPAYNPDWVLDAQGNVLIRGIWGLQPSRRFQLSFLLIE